MCGAFCLVLIRITIGMHIYLYLMSHAQPQTCDWDALSATLWWLGRADKQTSLTRNTRSVFKMFICKSLARAVIERRVKKNRARSALLHNCPSLSLIFAPRRGGIDYSETNVCVCVIHEAEHANGFCIYSWPPIRTIRIDSSCVCVRVRVCVLVVEQVNAFIMLLCKKCFLPFVRTAYG